MKDLNKSVDKFLKENPEIQEALDIFSISSKQYEKAVKSLYAQESINNFESTTTNGDMARNS